MNATFTPRKNPPWSINEKGIIFNEEEIKFTQIVKVKLVRATHLTNGVIIIYTTEQHANLILAFSKMKV